MRPGPPLRVPSGRPAPWLSKNAARRSRGTTAQKHRVPGHRPAWNAPKSRNPAPDSGGASRPRLCPRAPAPKVPSGNLQNLQLEGDAGMLFGPQHHEWLGYPDAQGAQVVQAGVTGGAEGDELLAVMDPWLTMMHMEMMMARSTATASVTVTEQDLVAQPGEALAGMRSRAVAGAAQSGDPG